MIPKALVVAVVTTLMIASAPAPARAQPGPAYYDAVGGCLLVMEGKADPDAQLPRAGLARQTQPHAGLKQFFYSSATDLRWYTRRLDAGTVHVGTAPSDSSCTVFLLGVPGNAFNTQVAARFVGWTRQPVEGGVAFSRKSLFGETVVVSIHDGPPTVQREQIGALTKVYILPK